MHKKDSELSPGQLHERESRRSYGSLGGRKANDPARFTVSQLQERYAKITWGKQVRRDPERALARLKAKFGEKRAMELVSAWSSESSR